MPEDPEVAAFLRKIRAHLRKLRKDKKRATGTIRFHTSTWAMGTSGKPFNTCSVRAFPGSVLPSVDVSTVDSYDLARCHAKGDHPSWLPLLAKHASGELLVEQRGKELLIAAGPVLVTINFSLEGCLAQCTSEEFARLTAQSVPGRNKDTSKALLMRSYLAPHDIFVPGSRAYRSKEVRYLNILLSVESKGTVFFVVDHNRLAQFRVLYREQHWTEADLGTHTSEIWPHDLGPDWVTQVHAAWAQADQWRERVLKSRAKRPIAAVLMDDRSTFNGFGRHTANDVCHKLRIHPAAAVSDVCADEQNWEHFKTTLHEYLKWLRSDNIMKRAGATINSPYPFQFHVSGSKYFINNCVSVFRKHSVRIPKGDYEAMACEGLFDPTHTIGEPYAPPVIDDPRYNSVKKPVFAYRIGKQTYFTAIQARPPPHWSTGSTHAADDGWRDLRLEGDTPTIGPQQFHIYNINRLHDANWEEYVRTLAGAAIEQGIDKGDVEQLPLTDDAGRNLNEGIGGEINSLINDDDSTNKDCDEIMAYPDMDTSPKPVICVKKPVGRPKKMSRKTIVGGRARVFSATREMARDRIPLSLLNRTVPTAGSAESDAGGGSENVEDLAPIATRTRKRKAAVLES